MVEAVKNQQVEDDEEAGNVWGDDIGGEKQKRKINAFKAWCAKVGIEYPDQEYPAEFENGLVGVKATTPILYRQAFLKVPHNCMMTVAGAMKHQELGPIIKASPELFSDEEQIDAAALTLVLYTMYEWQLGD